MKIFRTALTFDDNSDLHFADSIEHEGQMWLVPEWVELPAEGWRTPRRLICLNTMPHERKEGDAGGDLVVTLPIPKCVFNGEVPRDAKAKYVMVERPDIRVPIVRRA
jgi:hypothetical protein